MVDEEVRADSALSTNMQQEQNDLLARSTTLAATPTNMEDLKVHTSDYPGMVLVADPLRQIASISQGNMNVVGYYTKLRMLWDELECIDPTPDCDCSSQRTLANKLASNQLMQFLMGLNDSFDAIRNQILVMHPLPVVDKAYSLVLRVESQRQGQIHIEVANTNAALLAKNMDVKETEERKKGVGETKALVAKYENSRVQKPGIANRESISNILTEVLQLMKGKLPTDHGSGHFASIGEYAAILTATFIINRLPTSVLQWKSPYEVLYNKPVDYSMLKVFGCLAFAINLQPYKTKFAKLAHRCIFVGYATGQKGYKLFDLDDNVMLISRDVIFHEQVFSFKSLQVVADSASLTALKEPKNYAKTNTKEEWSLAMKAELELKLRADGSLDRYKARLVAKGSSIDMITEVKVFLDKLFTIKDLGTAKYFINLEIAYLSEGIIVTQAKYTKDIVLDVGLEHARSTTTPLPPGIKFSSDEGARLTSPESYRRLVGRLLYLNFTQPNISHTT
ncbi:UNVERIFIED_CONTAM: Retrovirus-related Pol polyprotein from transposon RE2 [Sesamum latifolium]|uniref:Retrovirus-related Pol polyprotein from transposon RE2 n=1 Tax=Sesamum latifolium TaxID=2727402 RepID=A0AAW2VZK9_9LAMI